MCKPPAVTLHSNYILIILFHVSFPFLYFLRFLFSLVFIFQAIVFLILLFFSFHSSSSAFPFSPSSRFSSFLRNMFIDLHSMVTNIKHVCGCFSSYSTENPQGGAPSSAFPETFLCFQHRFSNLINTQDIITNEVVKSIRSGRPIVN